MADIKYWAGGWWGQGSDETINDLINKGYWKIGWDEGGGKGKPFYNKLKKMEDKNENWFAFKSMAGPRHVKIYAIGKVTKIYENGNKDSDFKEHLKIKITQNYDPPRLLDRPAGDGAGNWGGTFTEITNSNIINKIFNISEEDKAKEKKVIKEYINIKSHEVKNYFSIKDKGITLSNLEDKKRIIFLGENGNGKTILLQSILISIYKSFINKLKTENEKDISILNNLENIIANTKGIELKTLSHNDIEYGSKSDAYALNIYGYGVNRWVKKQIVSQDKFTFIELLNLFREFGKKYDYNSFITLFTDETITILRHPSDWLQYLKKRNKKGEGFKLEYAVMIINELLSIDSNGEKPNFKIKEDGFFYSLENEKLPFNKLSIGYKNLIIWVCDLVSRLATNWPDVKPDSGNNKFQLNYEGIVIVDEIDLHIHPRWAINFIEKLKNWFPKIQFFFTTHNPVVILGIPEDKDTVFYKVEKDKSGNTNLSPPFYNHSFEIENSIKNYRLDQIVTELFGLDSALPPELYRKIKRRRELLSNENRDSDKEKELRTLNDDIGYIPVGETKEEIEIFKLMENFTKALKGSKND